MKDDLFPEAELRAFLKRQPEPSSDPAFESAVIARIRTEERLAVIMPAAAALVTLFLLVIAVHPLFASGLAPWASLPALLGQAFAALHLFRDAISAIAACAPSLVAAVWLELRPLLLTLAALQLLAVAARPLLRRISIRSTLSVL